MTGGSMGGTGALRHGLRHPDVFAAVMGVDGWTDFRLWHHHWYAREDYRDLIEEFRRPLLQAASPLYWAERGELGAIGHIVDGGDTVVLPENGLRLWRKLRDFQWDEPGAYDQRIIFNPTLGSPYILDDDDFEKRLEEELDAGGEKPVDFQQVAKVLLKYDCNCLLHGVFLVTLDGRMNCPRSLSSFIEASGVRVATSGGVKKDHIDATGGSEEREAEGRPRGSEEGFGHVPYSREEYTADEITAYFNLDLAQIDAFGLGDSARDLLVTMALYKIRRFLREGLRLRTACDLETAGDVIVKRPDGWELPDLATLEGDVPDLIAAVGDSGLFADPPVTTVTFSD
jgi:hypothetical protein